MNIFEALDAPAPDDRKVIYPGKIPASGQPHWLLVEDEEEDALTVEHTDACLNERGDIGCDVAYHEDEGLDWWFRRAVPGDQPSFDSIALRPGRYLIEAWSSRSYCHYYGTYEYDGGLALVYPEEAE
ncbi:hypothetical protein ACFXAF_00165 [Kitasatospora sp. NPDC059463]|uniref:hypothetical protein n=1 Tax=unclassified Kitasatospora TaxID=2633591 RepID=UPI00368BBC60